MRNVGGAFLVRRSFAKETVRRVLLLLVTCQIFLVTSSLSNAVRNAPKAPVFKVWISQRTDNRWGKGTEEDPYNANSAEKFDALMQWIPESTHIHLGPGTFYTRGMSNYGIQPKEGWIIEGAGKNLTTIKLADGKAVSAGVRYRVVGNNAGLRRGIPLRYLHYFSIRNLTIDANKANQPVYKTRAVRAKLYALRCGANNAEIINVRALGIWNYYGRGLESEGFPMSVEHDNKVSKTDHILYDGCEVIDPEGYNSAIAGIRASGSKGNYMRVTVRNCKVTNHLIGNCFGSVGALQTNLSGNYAYNCGSGTTMDTGNYPNMGIFNNRFVRMHLVGVNMSKGAGAYTNLVIRDNYFEMAATAGPAIRHYGAGTVTDVQIIGNTIIQRSRRSPAFVFKAGTTGSIRDNVVSEVKASDLSSTNLLVSRNFTPAKALVSFGVRSKGKGR